MPRKKKRRIMSINELYEFCLKNNFAYFSSDEFGKELMVRMNGNFEKSSKDEDKHKESLTPFISRAFHDHVNLNKSEISEESFNENVPSANFRPILAHITTNSDQELDFGSHDYYIISDKDGNDKVIYEEQPIGVIDGSKTSIEYDEEAKVNRAVLHGYLYDEYCQDAIDILNRRGTVDCSVELCIRELSFNNENKTLMLDDFYVSGLTLLGKDVSPGMAGSNFKIDDFAVNTGSVNFSADNNSLFTKYENKMIEFQERLEKLESTCSNIQLSKEGGNDKNMDKFNELLEKYGKTADDIDFEYEDMTDEELESKFEEVFGKLEENSTSEPSNDEGTDDGDESEENPEVKEDNACGGGGSGSKKKKKNSAENEPMTRTYEISHDDIRYALYNLLSSYEESDNDWYYITGVYDSYFVYESWDGGKIYGQKYTKDNDNVAFDGERYTLHKEYLTDSEYTEIQNMRSNYSTIVNELNQYKYNEEFADKMTVFEDEAYTEYLETDEFKTLMSKETVDKYSKEELAEKADATLGKFVKSTKTFSYTENKTKKPIASVKVFSDVNKTRKPSRYGDLFKNE